MQIKTNIIKTLEEGLASMCNLSDYIEEIGIQKGCLQTLFSLVQDGLLSVEIATERAKLPLEEFNILYREYQQEVLG